jgi:arylsulfatase A-like enzyme
MTGQSPRAVARVLSAVLLLLVASASTASPRPNILFVFSDDHASHAISAYGSRINRTPHIDRLAAEGMRFDNAFVTNAICGPSRAVILTGKHSHRNGHYTNGWSGPFDGNQVTFPRLMREAGYQTALIGKWHLGSEPTGFDYWTVLSALGGQGTYYNPEFRSADGDYQETGYTTDLVTDRTLAWLQRERDPGRPFLLMYQHKAPHREWAPALEDLDSYDGRDIPVPTDFFDDHDGRADSVAHSRQSIARDMTAIDLKLTPPGYLNEAQRAAWDAYYEPRNRAVEGLAGRELALWKYQRYIKDYLRSVDSIDRNLGRVLDYLDESGLAASTVVIYSSDQGFFLGDHGWFDKRWMYEESLRIPLLVRWPGVVTPGAVDRHLVQNLDLAQTLLEMAGVAAPPDMQGRSLVPILRGAAPAAWRDAIYYHFYENPGWHYAPRHYGIRTERYKLIHYYRLGFSELFDLQQDPDELVNLFDESSYVAVRRDLETRLQRLRLDYGVPEQDPEPSLVRRLVLEFIIWLADFLLG